MKPLIISKEDYDSGNYPKDVPIMVSMNVGMEGRSSFNVGKKEPAHIKITLKPA